MGMYQSVSGEAKGGALGALAPTNERFSPKNFSKLTPPPPKFVKFDPNYVITRISI